MKRRRWLIWTFALSAMLLLADTVAWRLATGEMARAARDWATYARGRGLDVTMSEPVTGGWPLRASQRLSLQLGPGGVPAGLVIELAPTTIIEAIRPDRLLTELGDLSVRAPDGGEVSIHAAVWSAETRFADPGRGTMIAHDMLVQWSHRRLAVGRLSASAILDGPPTLTLAAEAIELSPSPSRLPAGMTRIRFLDGQAHLLGGWPPAATTASAAARAWRAANGGIAIERIGLGYGPLDATLVANLHLDADLAPEGEGTLTARGLPALLDQLGSAGAIPPRAGQAAAGVLMVLGGGGPNGEVPLPVALRDATLRVGGFPVARLGRLPWQGDLSP